MEGAGGLNRCRTRCQFDEMQSQCNRQYKRYTDLKTPAFPILLCSNEFLSARELPGISLCNCLYS